MKKLFVLFLAISLFLPLYAQEDEQESDIIEHDDYISEMWDTADDAEDLSLAEDAPLVEDGFEEGLEFTPKKPMTFPRESWEFGTNIGVGFANGLVGTGDIFKTNMEIDLDAINRSIPQNGANINANLLYDVLFINIKNITIHNGIWDFGLSIGADGKVNLNIPKSLFTLISEGNINQRSIDGTIESSGGVFAAVNLPASAQFGPLRVGLKPSLFAPLIYIPRSGINYHINTTDEFISVQAGGDILIYTPLTEHDGPDLQFGADFSVDGEYALFNFLDVGGSLTHIPLGPAKMQNHMRLTMQDIEEEIKPLNKEERNTKLKLDDMVYGSSLYKVHRPFRFDVYARYKPFYTEFLVVRPNIGFSAVQKQGYFNAGLEAQLNLKDLFFVRHSIGYTEAVWRHQLGLAVNLRAFELDLGAVLQSTSFTGTFKGQGFGVNIGWRFGW